MAVKEKKNGSSKDVLAHRRQAKPQHTKDIKVSGSGQQPSACLNSLDYADEEGEDEEWNSDQSSSNSNEMLSRVSSQHINAESFQAAHSHRMHLTADFGNQIDIEDANDLIGGSNIMTRESLDAEEDDIEFNKPRFITIEDLNDLDTKQLKTYKKYNKDHKIFSFSLPFGQSNKIKDSGISRFNLVSPSTEASCTSITNDYSPGGSSPSTNDSTTETNTVNTQLMRSKTSTILKGETSGLKQQIKKKLKKTNSISSLEELELYRDETGIENVRNKAIKESLGIVKIKHQLKQIRMDDDDKTRDGYTYGRMNSIWDEIEGDFIVMGGYRGSILRDAHTHKRLWIPIKAGLNLRKIDLYIGPTEEDEIRAQKDVVADGMLTHIGPVDISRRLINRLDANPNVQIETFGYDWRLSLEIPCEQLIKRLKEIYRRQKSDTRYNGKPKGTYILAHSMGGLIAHKVLQEHPELIRGIVYIGSPTQCSNILGPIRFGDSVLLNNSLLSEEATFFMRSSHYFLPLDGRCFINRETYERYDFDFFNPEIWKSLGLSPLVSQKRLDKIKKEEKQDKHVDIFKKKTVKTTLISSLFSLDPPNPLTALVNVNSKVKDVIEKVPILGKEFANNMTDSLEENNREYNFRTSFDDSYEYLTRTLKKANAFLLSLDYNSSKDYPPLVTVYGNRVPTVRGCKVEGIMGIIDGDYEDLYYGAGDGVVHHSWLLPEGRGFPVVAKIVSETGHVSLMTDVAAMSKALISLYDADKERQKLQMNVSNCN